MPRRRGRPPGESDRRERILVAARTEFAARGYASTSMRAVARRAEVDAALVHHYFAGKEALFVAAMALPAQPALVMPAALAGDLAGLGERLTRLFLTVWGDEPGRTSIVSLLAAAATEESAAVMLRGFLSDALLRPVVEVLERADVEREEAELRTQAALAQLIGVGMLRWVVGVEPLRSTSDAEVVAVVAPAVQICLLRGKQP